MERELEWSFKPLTFVMRFVAGVPLHFTKNKPSITIRLLILLIGIFVLLFNAIINGPRGFGITRFCWMCNIGDYESPFLYFKDNPDAVLQFSVDVSFILIFVAVPLIHLVFMVTVLLSKNWTNMVASLKEIENKMEPSPQFYRKLRLYCLVALLHMILVLFQMIIFYLK